MNFWELAKQLRVDLTELKQLDGRVQFSDLKHMIALCPELGSAIRRAIMDVKDGRMTLKEFADKLS